MSDLAKLAMKILKVMEAVERIPKRGRNTHFNYDFATEADVMDTVRRECVKNNLVILPGILASERVGNTTIIKMDFTFIDAETGLEYKCLWQGEGADTQDKGTSKAGTSGEKYFLLKAFMIPTGDDPDASGPAKEEKPKAAPKPPAQKMEEVEADRVEAVNYLTKTVELSVPQMKAFKEKFKQEGWVNAANRFRKVGAKLDDVLKAIGENA